MSDVRSDHIEELGEFLEDLVRGGAWRGSAEGSKSVAECPMFLGRVPPQSRRDLLARPVSVGLQNGVVHHLWRECDKPSQRVAVEKRWMEVAPDGPQERDERWGVCAPEITLAEGATTYPVKSDKISDKAKQDQGGNFARLARYGIMEEFVKATMDTPIRGVPAIQWLKFFKRWAKGPEKS